MENIMTQRCLLAVSSLVLILAVPAVLHAQENKDRRVEQYQCKDIMRDSGENRDVSIAFLYGFLLGKSGDSSFNLDTVKRQTDAFIERCLSSPTERAMD